MENLLSYVSLATILLLPKDVRWYISNLQLGRKITSQV